MLHYLYRYLPSVLLLSALFCVPVLPVYAQPAVTSSVMASESARGQVARNMAKDLSAGSTETEEALYQIFMQVREELEKALRQAGLTTGDMGVAYGVYFITLWEIANEKKLPESQELKAVQYWVSHFDELQLNAATLGKNKDQFYDMLMHTPIILATLQAMAEQAGNKELQAVLPRQAAQLFSFVTRYPASAVAIIPEGGMKVNKEKMQAVLMSASEEEVRRLLKSSMSEAKINAFLEKRQKPARQAKSSDAATDQAIMDTYTSRIMTNTLMSFPNPW